MEEESRDFSLLPFEVAQGFFNHLSHAQRKKCRIICKRWRDTLDNYYPHYFAFRPILNNDSVTEFFNSTQIMDQVTMKDLTNEIPALNNFPAIRKAVIGAKNSEENIIRFLTHGCGEATMSLTLTNLSLAKLGEDAISQIWQDKSWTGLTKLNIFVIETTLGTHLEAIIHFLTSAQVPNTRKFSLEFINEDRTHNFGRPTGTEPTPHPPPNTPGQNLCLASFNFIAGHAQSLRTLFFRLSNKTPRKIDIPPILDILNAAAELQLESCSLTLSGVTHAEHLIVPRLFGSHMQSLALQTLPQTKDYRNEVERDVLVTEANRNILNDNIGQVFANNQGVLRSVTFWGFPFVTLAWFANCSALEAVKVGPQGHSYFFTRDNNIPHDIFNAASCASLRKIRMEDLRINFSWFRNCVNLEELNIFTYVGISTTQPEALMAEDSRMNLRKIKLVMVAVEDQNSVPEIQRMLERSGPSVQYFDVEICIEALMAVEQHFVHLAFNLSQCTNIKHLQASVYGISLMRYNLDNNFQNLIFLECCIDTVQLAEAIVENMKNLLSVGIIMVQEDYIPFVRILIQLPKVREIDFKEPQDPRGVNGNGIQNFFDRHPNLTLSKGKPSDWNKNLLFGNYQRMMITVDRSPF